MSAEGLKQKNLDAMAPPRGSANQAIGNEAEPEVDEQTKIGLKKLVARGWGQRRHQDVIRGIAQQHGQQRLQKVSRHRYFRHRAFASMVSMLQARNLSYITRQKKGKGPSSFISCNPGLGTRNSELFFSLIPFW